jgi:cell division protein FtsZ
MSFSIEFADDTDSYRARIKVVGVGGSGNNAINTMIHFGLDGVEFLSEFTSAPTSRVASVLARIPSAVERLLSKTCSASRSRSRVPTWSS